MCNGLVIGDAWNKKKLDAPNFYASIRSIADAAASVDWVIFRYSTYSREATPRKQKKETIKKPRQLLPHSTLNHWAMP